MQVYKLNVTLNEFKNEMWREIEVSSSSTVAKLAYSILASFEAEASHLFNITYFGERFEFVFDNMNVSEYNFYNNPADYLLSELDFEIGDKFVLEYDYGVGWSWTIEVMDIYEMKKGTHRHYPYLIDGNGRGIIEDFGMDEFRKILLSGTKNQFKVDFSKFDKELINRLLKSEIEEYKKAYEQHLVVQEKRKFVKRKNSTSDNIIDFEVQKMWLSIPEELRNMYLKNAFCFNCCKKYDSVSFKPGYKVVKEGGLIVIMGECEHCGEKIVRMCI